MRYFEHTTLCQVCDLLGLPHPKEYSHTVTITINIDDATGEEDKAWMTEKYSHYSSVSTDGKVESTIDV